jgi:hypothetical protein
MLAGALTFSENREMGVGAFQYEAQNLIGVEVNVIPAFALSKTDDEFVRSVKENVIPL